VVDEDALIVGIRVDGDSQGFDLYRCRAELQPPPLEVEVIDVQSGGVQNGVAPPRNLDHIVFFPQRIRDEQREMDCVGLIDRIKVKINGAVRVVQTIALLSIHPPSGSTLPNPEHIAVGQARSVSCVSVPSRPSFMGHQCLTWLIDQNVIEAWIHWIGVGLGRRLHLKTLHFDDIGLDFPDESTDQSRHQSQTPMVAHGSLGPLFISLLMFQHVDSSLGSR